MYIKRELLNPTGFKFEPTQSNFFETVKTVYDLAYRLLCDTIGEENVAKQGERRHYTHNNGLGVRSFASTCYEDIPIEKVAERMGIEFCLEGSLADEHREDITRKNAHEIAKELISCGEIIKPQIDFWGKENIFVRAEIMTIRPIMNNNDNSYRCRIRVDHLGNAYSQKIRYNLARAIAKMYFSTDLFDCILNQQFVFFPYIINDPREIVEEIFAAALILPDKLMVATSEEFDCTSCSIGEHLELVAGVGYEYVMEILKWWNFYRASLTLENEKQL